MFNVYYKCETGTYVVCYARNIRKSRSYNRTSRKKHIHPSQLVLSYLFKKNRFTIFLSNFFERFV
jgi:hypothetical protein